VLDAYWRDHQDHVADYQPLTLVNDVVRYWRTLILNYVAKNLDHQQASVPEKRLGSYKLRFSRCLTCFSLLGYLLAVTGTQPSVGKEDVLQAVKTAPINRLGAIAKRNKDTRKQIDELRELYARFLMNSDADKETLIGRFDDPTFRAERSHEAQQFGDKMFDLLKTLGRTKRGHYLLRYMVV
jgi:hypothetical protein